MSRRTNPIASGVLAFVLGVLSALALAHWFASCWDAGAVAMCTLLAPALPVRGRARTWWRRAVLWWHQQQMDETERNIAQYRRLLLDDSLHLEQLRQRLGEQQRAQLQRLSRP